MDQGCPNLHVSNAIKLAVNTKEPSLEFLLSRVIHGIPQFASALIQVFSMCRKGLPLH